jgi:hypothetical protein
MEAFVTSSQLLFRRQYLPIAVVQALKDKFNLAPCILHANPTHGVNAIAKSALHLPVLSESCRFINEEKGLLLLTVTNATGDQGLPGIYNLFIYIFRLNFLRQIEAGNTCFYRSQCILHER